MGENDTIPYLRIENLKPIPYPAAHTYYNPCMGVPTPRDIGDDVLSAILNWVTTLPHLASVLCVLCVFVNEWDTRENTTLLTYLPWLRVNRQSFVDARWIFSDWSVDYM